MSKFKVGDLVYYADIRGIGEIIEVDWVFTNLCLVSFHQYFDKDHNPIDMQGYNVLSANNEMNVYENKLIYASEMKAKLKIKK